MLYKTPKAQAQLFDPLTNSGQITLSHFQPGEGASELQK